MTTTLTPATAWAAPVNSRTIEFDTADGTVYVTGDVNVGGGARTAITEIDGAALSYAAADGKAVWTFTGDLAFASGDTVRAVGATPVSLVATADAGSGDAGNIDVPDGVTFDLSGAGNPDGSNGGGGAGGDGGVFGGAANTSGADAAVATDEIAIAAGDGGNGGQADQLAASGNSGGDGGNGGGALELISDGTLTIAGSLTTEGVDGQSTIPGFSHGDGTGSGGGGGGGGDIHFSAAKVNITGSTDATGGAPSAGEAAIWGVDQDNHPIVIKPAGASGARGTGGRLIFDVVGTGVDASSVVSVQASGAVEKLGVGDLFVTGAGGVTVTSAASGPNTVSLEEGLLEIDHDLTSAGSGSVVAADGTTLNVRDNLQMQGGSVTIDDGATLDVTNGTSISGGTLFVNGDATLGGTGMSGGALTVGTTGDATLGDTVIDSGAALTVRGTANAGSFEVDDTGYDPDIPITSQYVSHVLIGSGNTTDVATLTTGAASLFGGNTIVQQQGEWIVDSLVVNGFANLTVHSGSGAADGTLTVLGSTVIGENLSPGDKEGTLNVNGQAALGGVTLERGGTFNVGGFAKTGHDLTSSTAADDALAELNTRGSVTVNGAGTLLASDVTVYEGTLAAVHTHLSGDAYQAHADAQSPAGTLFGQKLLVSADHLDHGTASVGNLTVTGAGTAVADGGALIAETLNATDGGTVTVKDHSQLNVTSSQPQVAATTIGGGAAESTLLVEDGGEASLGQTLVQEKGTLTVLGDVDTLDGTHHLRDTNLDGGTLTVGDGELKSTFDTHTLDAKNSAIVDVKKEATLTADTVKIDDTSDLTVALGGVLNAQSVDYGQGSKLEVKKDTTLTVSNGVTFTGDSKPGHSDGSTTVVNGTYKADNFTLEQGATLGGSGTFEVTGPTGTFEVAGNLNPGNSPGVLNVIGTTNVAPTAVLGIELVATPPGVTPVAGRDFDQFNVAGAVMLDGNTVNVSQFGGSSAFIAGTQYDIVVASDGVTVQNDPIVNSLIPNRRFLSRTGPNTFSVIVARNGLYRPSLGNTVNRYAVGGGLDAVRDASALASLRDAIDTLPNKADAARALDQLSGEIYGSHLTTLNRTSLQFLDAIAARDAAFPLVCGNCGVTRAGQSGLRGWWDAGGASGQADGDANAGAAEIDAAGTSVGLSRIFGTGEACVAVGGFYGYESVNTQVDSVRSRAETDAHRFGGFLRANSGPIYGRLTAFGGATETDARRSILIDSAAVPFADFNSSSFNGSLAGADAETGVLLGGPAAFLMPVAGLRYVTVSQDGFAEDGGVSALTVSDSSLKELRARIGARAGFRAPDTVLPVTGTLEAFYSRDISAGSVGDVTSVFAAAPGAPFTTRGTDFGRDRVVLGQGVTIGDGPLQLGIAYRAGLSDESLLHAGDVRLEVCF